MAHLLRPGAGRVARTDHPAPTIRLLPRSSARHARCSSTVRQAIRPLTEVIVEIRFWGVRGSIAVGGEKVVRTGGNTACVEVVHDGARLILDAGTGIRALGDAHPGPMDATLLFSHVHWDHIQGLPFFAPAYHPASRLRLLGPRGVHEALAAQMRPPTFPIGLGALAVVIEEVADEARVGPFRLRAVEQAHPDGVRAWRIEAGGRAFVYATDVEHAGRPDERLIALADGADLLVHDAQYTDVEAPHRRGWGHSTWREALAVAMAAGARRLGLFHHDPRRDDDAVAVIEDRARDLWDGVFAAREGAAVAL